MTVEWVNVGVTILGFIVTTVLVVYTLNRNARLQREGIDQQQRAERQSIRMAVVQELISNREMLQNDEVSDRGVVRSTPYNEVYQALLSKLGSLKELEIHELIRAHDALTIFAANVHNLGLKGADMDGFVHLKLGQLARYEELRAECLPRVYQCIQTILGKFDSENTGVTYPELTR